MTTYEELAQAAWDRYAVDGDLAALTIGCMKAGWISGQVPAGDWHYVERV